MIQQTFGDTRPQYIKERLNEIKQILRAQGHECSNEFIEGLCEFSQKFYEMQMWLFEMKIKGKYFNANDVYIKLFELKTNEEIVANYDKYVESLNNEEDKVVIKKRYVNTRK